MKIKTILFYLLQFILASLLTVFASLCILKLTLLNEQYFINTFNQKNYYHDLNVDIKEEMKNYTIQSGFTDQILENIYTEEDIKNDMEQVIKSIFQNQKIEVSTTDLETNLRREIASYLSEKNIQITDDKDLDNFIDLMVGVYEEEFTFSNSVQYIQKVVTKAQQYLTPTLVGLTMIIVALSVISKVLYNKNSITIPLLTTSIIFLIVPIYFRNAIDIQNLLVFTSKISEIIKYIFMDITANFINIGITILVLAIISSIVGGYYVKKRNH